MVKNIVSIIGWIGTALVFGAVIVRFLRPEWNQYASYAAMGGLACVLIYMAGQWRDVATFYQGRGARYGTLSIVSIVVFLGILVAVNYLATRQNKRWDFTANQVYSLSDQTVKLLQSLKDPVKFTVFDQQVNFDRFKDRMNEFTYHSTNVSVEYVDADREPSRAKAAGIQSYGTIVIDYQGRTERVTSTSEQDLTNALVKAVTGTTRKVYFTSGHGEKDTAASDRVGYSAISQGLTGDNFGVERLVLAQQRAVPADATVVVIAGPRTDFLQPEIDALKEYLAKGGKVMALLDPPEKGQTGQPLLTAFLREWGMDVGNNIVLGHERHWTAAGDGCVGAGGGAVSEPRDHGSLSVDDGLSCGPIGGTGRGRRRRPHRTAAGGDERAELGRSRHRGDLFRRSRRVRREPGRQARADHAWSGSLGTCHCRLPLRPDGKPADPNKPAEPERKPESRVVALGDSDFAANAFLGIQGNRDFFMNAVNWLAQQENMIAIRPREPEDRRITLTADQQQRIMLLSIFIIPGLVFASGVYTWWKRR